MLSSRFVRWLVQSLTAIRYEADKVATDSPAGDGRLLVLEVIDSGTKECLAKRWALLTPQIRAACRDAGIKWVYVVR